MRIARAASQSLLKSEALEHRLVAPPLGPRLHLQLEEDRMPEDELDLRARTGADLLHDRAALADDDLLLRLGLDKDRRADDLVGQLLDLDRERVRHLLAGHLERLLGPEPRN